MTNKSIVDRIVKLEQRMDEIGELVGVGWQSRLFDTYSDEYEDERKPAKPKPSKLIEDEDESDEQDCFVIHSVGKGNKQDMYLVDDLLDEDNDEWTLKVSQARRYFDLKEAEDDCRCLKSPDKWHRKPTVLEIENE